MQFHYKMSVGICLCTGQDAVVGIHLGEACLLNDGSLLVCHDARDALCAEGKGHEEHDEGGECMSLIVFHCLLTVCVRGFN